MHVCAYVHLSAQSVHCLYSLLFGSTIDGNAIDWSVGGLMLMSMVASIVGCSTLETIGMFIILRAVKILDLDTLTTPTRQWRDVKYAILVGIYTIINTNDWLAPCRYIMWKYIPHIFSWMFDSHHWLSVSRFWNVYVRSTKELVLNYFSRLNLSNVGFGKCSMWWYYARTRAVVWYVQGAAPCT